MNEIIAFSALIGVDKGKTVELVKALIGEAMRQGASIKEFSAAIEAIYMNVEEHGEKHDSVEDFFRGIVEDSVKDLY